MSNSLQVELYTNTSSAEEVIVEVFAADGKLVKIQKVHSVKTEGHIEQIIDVSGLKEGVYNISITTESGKLHKQFIKIN